MNTVVAQNQQAFSSKKSTRRHLDHMPDFQNGYPFVMVPQFLIQAKFKGDIEEARFNLILCMMSHSETFHVKRAYLEKIFSKKTLATYLPKMEEDGWIRRERAPCETGGYRTIYHTNSLTEWKINGEPVPPPSYPSQNVDRSPGNRSLGNPLNNINPNQNDSLSSKESAERFSEEEPSASEDKDVKKTEDSLEGKKVEKTEFEEAAEELAKDLEEYDVPVKLKDLALAIKQGCEKRGCTPKAVIAEKADAILYITSRNSDKRPVWHFRNWMRYNFEWPKLSQQVSQDQRLKTNDAPAIIPKSEMKRPATAPGFIDADELIARMEAEKNDPERIAAQAQRAKELRAQVEALKARGGRRAV